MSTPPDSYRQSWQDNLADDLTAPGGSVLGYGAGSSPTRPAAYQPDSPSVQASPYTWVPANTQDAGQPAWGTPTPMQQPAGQPPSPYPNPQQYFGVPRPVPINAMAVASLVVSFLGMSFLAVIFGHIALAQIKRTGASGKALAIVGLVIGYLAMLLIVFFFLAWLGFAYMSTL